MNIPHYYPSPDQDNVYYSIASLKTMINRYFSIETANSICSPLKDLRLPVFVFDDSNAPNSYTITIFTKSSQPITKLIDSNGNYVDSIETKEVTPAKVENDLIDNATGVELDKSFHSTDAIRTSEFALELSLDDDQKKTENDDPYEMELLLGTKYQHNRKLIDSRARYLEIIKRIVSDTLRNMPPEEYEILIKKYQ